MLAQLKRTTKKMLRYHKRDSAVFFLYFIKHSTSYLIFHFKLSNRSIKTYLTKMYFFFGGAKSYERHDSLVL